MNTVHTALPEKANTRLKADLRKAKIRTDVDLRKAEIDEAALVRIGSAIDRMRQLAGLTLDQLAREIDRNPRQVYKWIKGKERPHFDAIFRKKHLQQPFVIALAELADAGVQIDTVIRVSIKEKTA